MSQTTYSERSIESWLWDAANILRGPVDASDFKAYIFPLLFLKRISDVYDEERAAALAESDGDAEYADQPEQHRFLIPAGCQRTDRFSLRGRQCGWAEEVPLNSSPGVVAFERFASARLLRHLGDRDVPPRHRVRARDTGIGLDLNDGRHVVTPSGTEGLT